MLSIIDAVILATFYALIAKAVGPIVISGNTDNLDYLYFALLFIFLRLIVKLVIAKINSSLLFKVEESLRFSLVDKLISVGPLSFSVTPKLPAVFVDAVNDVVPYFTHYLTACHYAISIPCVLLVAVFIASPLQGLILLILCPLIPIFMILIGKKAEQLNQRQWLQITRLSSYFHEAMHHLTIIKLFNIEKKEINKIYLLNKRWRVETMQVLKVAFLSALALEFFSTVGVAFCAVTLGFAVYDYGFDYSLALFVLFCAPEFFVPLRNMGQNYHARMKALGAATTMVDLLFSKDQIAFTQDINNNLLLNTNNNVNQSFDLKLENVSLQYPDGRFGIVNKSLSFEHNKITAIVGPSGCGKSTVLMLCAGLLEASDGKLYVNNQDIHDIDIKEYRKQITYIPQNPHLFFGTIGENLNLSVKNLDESYLKACLEKINASFLIDRFKDGFNHKILNFNYGISGGEARLIALARSLIADSKIILLDEPTASLDKESEQVLLNALLKISQQRTVIVAAHRKELINIADKVIEL